MSGKILIIENDSLLRDGLAEKLKVAGYEVKLTRAGTAGIDRLREWKPDIALLDMSSPNANGAWVLGEKLKDKAISKIPIIVVSSAGQPNEISRLLALGASDYVVKAQLDATDVLAKIRLLLNKDEETVNFDEKERAAGGGSSNGSLRGKKIMWVEDDEFLSDIIARKFSAQGCSLVHTANGEEALPVLKKEHPDLVLLDILLPGIDGFEILRQIKSDSNTKEIPVILLSNLGQKADVDKGKELGAARFLIKATVTLDEIVEEIKTVLKEVSSK